MLLAVWAPESSRATRDLDLLGRGDASPDRAHAMFKEICRLPVEPDGGAFAADTVHTDLIREDQRYLGTRVKLEAHIAGAVIGLQVDSGMATPSCPHPR